MMKLDPKLLEQIIIASSIALLVIVLTCSVCLRRYKRKLLKIKITERSLINLISRSTKASSIEEISRIKFEMDTLSEAGTFDKELSYKYAKAMNYLEGKAECIRQKLS